MQFSFRKLPLLSLLSTCHSKSPLQAFRSLSQPTSINNLQIRFGGMADRTNPPYVPQNPVEVGKLIESLNTHSKHGRGRGSFGVRKKTYEVSDKDHRTVDSWSMNDWDYKKPKLPTYARGLFTHSNNGRAEIAVRGYDKFFNVEEVHRTRWRNIEQNTRGPYELSVKENGCIIFIGGLDDNTLLVTSKHSMGPRQDNTANHAFAGEVWVEKQLAALGKTKADLAQTLRRMNPTAVAELCDDEFEEHVLRYGPDASGLYLHGINLNIPDLATYPGNLVEDFAQHWGFKKTMYVIKDDLNQVKSFLDKIAETGNYAGRDTEGFVIRCQARHSTDRPWHDWFFKYKFEEPYLMYRQWREVTKSIIAGKTPTFKKHQAITKEYIIYARRQLAKDPQIGKLFNQNHGIIAMRDGFLQQKGVRGSDIIHSELEQSDGTGLSEATRNIVLVPVATIGCGKTTVALALTKLFDWGHEQNDNVQGKGNRPQRFATLCTNAMALHPVIIADRNNHMRRERDQIVNDIKRIIADVKFVALHYVHDTDNYDEIRKAMQKRVLSRGDNHQTIQADSKGSEEIIGIMDGFMRRFEPVDPERPPDDAFDQIIDLDVTASSRENLGTVVHQLHQQFPKLFQMPSDEQLDGALEWALYDYKPDIKHDLSKGGGNKKKPDKQQKPSRVEFFCVQVPAQRVTSILGAVFASEGPDTARFYNQLKIMNRIQTAFHVTLLHRAQSSQFENYWVRLVNAYEQSNSKVLQESNVNKTLKAGAPTPVEMASSRVLLERVIWDDRVMAIQVKLLDAEQNGFETTNAFAHITVGTAGDSIKPKESNELLLSWSRGQGDGRIREVTVRGHVVVDGSVRAVMSR